jgi:hypothetical protein
MIDKHNIWPNSKYKYKYMKEQFIIVWKLQIWFKLSNFHKFGNLIWPFFFFLTFFPKKFKLLNLGCGLSISAAYNVRSVYGNCYGNCNSEHDLPPLLHIVIIVINVICNCNVKNMHTVKSCPYLIDKENIISVFNIL